MKLNFLYKCKQNTVSKCHYIYNVIVVRKNIYNMCYKYFRTFSISSGKSRNEWKKNPLGTVTNPHIKLYIVH